MKSSSLFPLLMILSLFATAGAKASSDAVEVPIRAVFAPARGFDDNDNVQIMIEGELPDPCYVLGAQKADIDASTGAIEIHQLAWRRGGGACDTGDLLGESPFTADVSLGRLKAGDYRIRYSPTDDATAFTPLHVDRAPVTAVDDFNYAHVTNVAVPDVVLERSAVTVKISGTFASSCNRIKDPISVERQGNVIVIRPIEIQLGDCGWSLRYFERSIPLGRLAPGQYLIHVRSRNGKAVQRVFEVMPE